MYNGIGLQTVRGSGTNGYVQNNLSFVKNTRDKVKYRDEDELKRLDAQVNREPNVEILDHQRKRQIELKCAEYEELLQAQELSPGSVERRVDTYRQKLADKLPRVDRDEQGRPLAAGSHQMAEAQQEKNARLKDAFGISEHFVEGSSFDPNRRAKEEEARKEKEAQQKVYAPVRSPARVPRRPRRNTRRTSRRRRTRKPRRRRSQRTTRRSQSLTRRRRARTRKSQRRSAISHRSRRTRRDPLIAKTRKSRAAPIRPCGTEEATDERARHRPARTNAVAVRRRHTPATTAATQRPLQRARSLHHP